MEDPISRKTELDFEAARRQLIEAGEDPAGAACEAYTQWIAALERFEVIRDLPLSDSKIEAMENAAAEVAAWGAKAAAATDLIDSKALVNALQLALMEKGSAQ